MIFKKPNIIAIHELINEWTIHVDAKYDIKQVGACFKVGYMAIGYSGGLAAKPTSLGFTISITSCINSLDYINYDTCFFQTKNGIAWRIVQHKGNTKVLYHGTFNDVSILTNNPCPSLVKERMFKVALAAVDIALVEHKLMHL